MVTLPSLDRANMMSLYISDEVDLLDDYQDEIAMMIEYPEWLANVILVPKKDDKVRVCVDFRDLNKDNPKMTFPYLTLIFEECRGYISRMATTIFHDMILSEGVLLQITGLITSFDSGVIDDDFLDEGIVIVTRLLGWCMYFNESRIVPTYCCLIDDAEIWDDFP
ncbi:hypothetical protein AAG906_003713 [Vitis piasezkii]